MAHFIFKEIALKIATILLVVDIIRAVVVEVVVEVEAVVAVGTELNTNTSTVACDLVIEGVWLSLIVSHHAWGVERIVQLEQHVWSPTRVANTITRQSETRQALLGEQSRTFESRHGHRHTSLGVRKEKKETLGPPRRENKTQPG